MSRRTLSFQATCSVCGRTFHYQAGSGSRLRKTCGTQCLSQRHSQTMARTNRKYAGARMSERNPMHSPQIRGKVSATLRAMAHAPKVRGGNGTGPTSTELALARAISLKVEGVALSLAIPTGQRYGVPTHYKADIAHVASRTVVEVDGRSHALLSRRAQDAKKEAWLAGHGWYVLRFSTSDVRERLRECAQTALSTISKRLAAATSRGAS